MIVSKDDLELTIKTVVDNVQVPDAGIYGPGSAAWRINRESILFLGGGRAALLQLAHPFVAHAIEQHSDTRKNPLGRFQRTFQHVFDMVFGDLDHAVNSARRVHAIHERVVGHIGEATDSSGPLSRYAANEANALFWVHATLLDSALSTYELLIQKVPMTQKAQYYEESKRFARLFGIPDAVMPTDYPAFQAYNQDMWQRLRVCAPAKDIAHFLLRPPALRSASLARWLRLMTAGMLPPPLRTQFEFRFERHDKLAFNASVHTLRSIYRRLPQRLRFMPAYNDALRRLAGQPGRDPVGLLFDRLMQSALGERLPS